MKAKQQTQSQAFYNVIIETIRTRRQRPGIQYANDPQLMFEAVRDVVVSHPDLFLAEIEIDRIYKDISEEVKRYLQDHSKHVKTKDYTFVLVEIKAMLRQMKNKTV
jgi:hypothetical protein